MVRLFPSGRLWRLIAVLWIFASVSLLVHTLLHRNDPPHAFGDAEEMESLLMVALSYPTSLIAYVPQLNDLLSFGGAGLSYPENDPRSILVGWLVFFVSGYLQWFVLLPLIVRVAGRKFGKTRFS